MRSRIKRLSFGVWGASLVACSGLARAQDTALADLSLEELTQIPVTLVSRRPEPVGEAPASIFVIRAEDIRRSGVTSLPEALRLAPNLSVARVDPVQYAISARGFNNAVGNKLLVMIDGRTVYTPLFSGVFWDQQDVLLADVERIEVISGPGAALWGANAVNGVINVVTRSAADTQGAWFSVGAGTLEREAAFRYGGTVGENGHYRVYVKSTDLDNFDRANGAALANAWNRNQAGFRADWDLGADRLTVQADAYGGDSEDRGSVMGIAFGSVEVSGANVLARWNRTFEGGSELQVQSYFDHATRDDFLFFRPKADIFDVEAQHTIPLGRHEVLWGGGYRRSSDRIESAFATTFIPEARDLSWQNVFVQDRIAIGERVETTLGLKLERNDYTGTESLPSLRVAFKPGADRLLWAAVSRAVRAPSRYDRDVFFPGAPPFLVIGGPNFVSEVAHVIDLGYRAEPVARASYSVTIFEHDWDKLRSGTSLPVQLVNEIEGPVRGVEAWGDIRLTSKWQLGAGVTLLDKDLRLKPGSTDPVGVANETLANDADSQWQLRATADLARHVELDLRVRHSASLPSPALPAYTAVDATLAWRPRARLAVRAVVQNAFDASHAEYGPAPTRSEIPRAVLVEITRAER